MCRDSELVQVPTMTSLLLQQPEDWNRSRSEPDYFYAAQLSFLISDFIFSQALIPCQNHVLAPRRRNTFEIIFIISFNILLDQGPSLEVREAAPRRATGLRLHEASHRFGLSSENAPEDILYTGIKQTPF